MALLPDRERAVSLAKHAGVWKSYVDGSWFTDGSFAIRVAVPFAAPHELRLFCSCARETLEHRFSDGSIAPGAHYFDLDRPCVYVKTWEPNTMATVALEALSAGRVVLGKTETPITFGDPYQPNPEAAQTMVMKATYGPGPKDWFSVRPSIVNLINQEGDPDRWLKVTIKVHQCEGCGRKAAKPILAEGIAAMHGSLIVGVMMPLVMEGSGLDLKKYKRNQRKIEELHQQGMLDSIPEEIRRFMPPEFLKMLEQQRGESGAEVTIKIVSMNPTMEVSTPTDSPTPEKEDEAETVASAQVLSWLRGQFGDEPDDSTDVPRD